MQTKRKNISVRMSAWEQKRVREIAERLGVKESDMIRYSISNTLGKLMPFHDRSYKGASLMPAVLDSAEELLRYFHLDAEQLNKIINDGVDDPHKRVAEEDLEMLVLGHFNEQYIQQRLAELCDGPVDGRQIHQALRDYLVRKYISATSQPLTTA
ncbi:MAG TPA: hypothetical protein PK129_18430 [Cellvibrionaceae bacterium]|nr:hypothetical protein [Cellvibrionaceae bacterium]